MGQCVSQPARHYLDTGSVEEGIEDRDLFVFADAFGFHTRMNDLVKQFTVRKRLWTR